jgi:2-dehydropantoate 2-reductase
MKIAVVGAGALGGYYGAKLCRAGQEVHFLLRSDYEAVRRNGVSVVSPEGDVNARPRCARTPEDIGPSDVVLIGLKTTANGEFPKLLPPLVGPATAVVTLQNGLGNEEALARLFPPGQILAGLCFVCLNRIEPGVIHHTGYGMVVLGEFQRWPEPRTHEIAALFRNAGVNCKVTEDLARAHWEKLVWNIPFNGLGVASAAGFDAFIPEPSASQKPRDRGSVHIPDSIGPCLTTDRLLADPCWEGLVLELMLEVIRAANALGFHIPESLAEKQIDRTRAMGEYKASTLIDFEQGRPLELEGLFLEPLRRAKTAGVSVPKLGILCGVLQRLSRRNPG